MSSRRRQDIFARRLQDVLEDVKLLRLRRVEDVFKTNKYLLGDDNEKMVLIKLLQWRKHEKDIAKCFYSTQGNLC